MKLETKLYYSQPRTVTYIAGPSNAGASICYSTQLYKLQNNIQCATNESEPYFMFRNRVTFFESKKCRNGIKHITFSFMPYIHSNYTKGTDLEETLLDWIDLDMITDSEYIIFDRKECKIKEITDKRKYFDIIIDSLENSSDEKYKKIPEKLFARFKKTKSARNI